MKAGAKWRPNTMIGMIGDHDVMLIDVHSQATETLEDVDAVIVRTHGTPVDELYHALVERSTKSSGSATPSPCATATAPSTTATPPAAI